MKYVCSLNQEFNEEFIAEMSKIFNLDEHLIRLLCSRGVDTQEKINSFLNPSITHLHDPFLFENMKESVELIEKHIERNSKFLIFGDYDVDGISASAILIKYFESVGVRVSSFMPNRYEDGYGLNIATIEKILVKDRPDIVITVDCGITSVQEVEFLKDKGIDIVVTDHHERAETLPKCLIINPKVSETYPFKGLCGAGVALKLVQALAGITKASEYFPICAIANGSFALAVLCTLRKFTYSP